MKRGQGLEAKASSASQQRGRQHSLLCDPEASFTLDLPTRIRQHCELWRICPVSNKVGGCRRTHNLWDPVETPGLEVRLETILCNPQVCVPPGAQEKGDRADSRGLSWEQQSFPSSSLYGQRQPRWYTQRENTIGLKGREINVSSNVTTPAFIAVFLDAQQ